MRVLINFLIFLTIHVDTFVVASKVMDQYNDHIIF